MVADITYRFDRLFFRLMPQSDRAEDAWRLIAEVFPAGVVPASAWQSTRAQLREAGYSVRKAGPVVSKMSDDKILAELAA